MVDLSVNGNQQMKSSEEVVITSVLYYSLFCLIRIVDYQSGNRLLMRTQMILLAADFSEQDVAVRSDIITIHWLIGSLYIPILTRSVSQTLSTTLDYSCVVINIEDSCR